MFENDGRHIETVVWANECKRHNVGRGEPCFVSYTGADEMISGVCGKRIKKAGFNGKIDPRSLSMGGSKRGR